MTTAELRPLSLGEVLDRTFSLYRRHFWLFIGIMAAPNLVLLAVQVAFAGAGWMEASGQEGGSGAFLVGLFGGAAVVGIGYLVAYAMAQGATVMAVADVHLNRPTSVRRAYSGIRGNIFKVALVFIVVSLAVMAGLILLIIPGIWVLLRTGVAVPVAVLEPHSALDSVNRSVELTKGFALRIGVVYVLVFVLTIAGSLLFQYPLLLITGMSPGTEVMSAPWFLALNYLGEFLTNTLVGPLGTIAFALLYYDLRVRKEAFDLELMLKNLDPGSQPLASA